MGYKVLSVSRFRNGWRAEIANDSKPREKRIRPVIQADSESDAWDEARFIADRMQALGGDLSEVLERYIRSQEEQLARETAEGYRRVARRILKSDEFRLLDPATVTRKSASAYFELRRDAGAGAGTLRAELSLLRKAFDRVGILAGRSNHFRSLDAPAPASVPSMTSDELARVTTTLSQMSGLQSIAGSLALEECLKVREIAALKVGDFDLDRGVMNVRATTDRYRNAREQPARRIAMGEITIRAVSSYLEDGLVDSGDYLFGGSRPGSVHEIERDFADAVRPFGIDARLSDLKRAGLAMGYGRGQRCI